MRLSTNPVDAGGEGDADDGTCAGSHVLKRRLQLLNLVLQLSGLCCNCRIQGLLELLLRCAAHPSNQKLRYHVMSGFTLDVSQAAVQRGREQQQDHGMNADLR